MNVCRMVLSHIVGKFNPRYIWFVSWAHKAQKTGGLAIMALFQKDGLRLEPRGATLHQLTPDVWAQIGGKWVLLGHGGRETVSSNMGIFLEGLHLYGCVFREFTTIWG